MSQKEAMEEETGICPAQQEIKKSICLLNCTNKLLMFVANFKCEMNNAFVFTLETAVSTTKSGLVKENEDMELNRLMHNYKEVLSKIMSNCTVCNFYSDNNDGKKNNTKSQPHHIPYVITAPIKKIQMKIKFLDVTEGKSTEIMFQMVKAVHVVCVVLPHLAQRNHQKEMRKC
eukprot:15041935-Ditylum_brightwellii.AAC.1